VTITLNSCQLAAVDSFVEFLFHPAQSELVISGFAGTGKTTLVKYLIDNLDKYEAAAKALGKTKTVPQNVQITATTRKAAHVLAHSLNTEPSTIHSYLGLVLRNNYDTGETFLKLAKGAYVKSDTLIFIDEASFMNAELLLKVREMTSTSCKIVFMGDPCQLLQPGTFKSPVFDGKIPTVHLTTIMRNQGPIQELSAQFRESVTSSMFKDIITGTSSMVTHVSGTEFQSLIDAAFLSKDYVADKSAKVLAWSNTRVNDYNNYIADLRGITEPFPSGETLITNSPIMIYGKIEASTDSPVKVVSSIPTTMFGIDGYEVYLENIGVIFVPTSQKDAKALMKHYAKEKNWKKYFNIKDTWGDLRQPYASTVHKSQGSTYGQVFIDLSDIGRCNMPSDTARLLYVASSRPSDQVIMYGDLPPKYLGATNGGIQLQ